MVCTLSLFESIAKSKMKFARQVMRGSRGRLVLNILEGHVEGRSKGLMDDVRTSPVVVESVSLIVI